MTKDRVPTRDVKGRFVTSDDEWRRRARKMLEWMNPKLRHALEEDVVSRHKGHIEQEARDD